MVVPFRLEANAGAGPLFPCGEDVTSRHALVGFAFRGNGARQAAMTHATFLKSAAPAAMLGLSAAFAMLVPGSASAEPHASGWSSGMNSAVRLLDGGPGEAAGAREAGIEIRLDPHFKTYWRDPGEAGVPPTFDWSASRNVASVTVSWPAPIRFEEAGSFSIGYDAGIVLPLTVRAADPGKPVELDLAMTYAVCERICVPAEGHARLSLDAPALSTPVAQAIRAARARVPMRSELQAGAAPAIAAVRPTQDGAALEVDVAPLEGGAADLFVEGPEGWVFGAPKPAVASAPPGLVRWSVPVVSRPSADAALAGLDLVLTLTSGGKAVEVPARLPESPARG